MSWDGPLEERARKLSDAIYKERTRVSKRLDRWEVFTTASSQRRYDRLNAAFYELLDDSSKIERRYRRRQPDEEQLIADLEWKYRHLIQFLNPEWLKQPREE